MNTHDDARRPEQIENDIARKRADVSSTIDEIQARLTPGQLMDQAIHYLRNSGTGEFGNNLGRTVRDNPVPVALIGVGIAWLAMGGGQRSRYRSDAWNDVVPVTRGAPPRLDPSDALDRDPSEWDDDVAIAGSWGDTTLGSPSSDATGRGTRIRESVSDTTGRVRDTVSDATGRVRDAVSGTSGRARDAVSGAASAVSGAAQRARDLAHEASQRIGDVGHQVRGRASAMQWRTRDRVDRARERTARMIDEQPLVLGAVGVAIGAAIGAALPSTRREDAWMGEARDGLVEGAADTARDGMREAASSVQRVARTAREEVERAIDSPSDDDTRRQAGASTSSTSSASSAPSGSTPSTTPPSATSASGDASRTGPPH